MLTYFIRHGAQSWSIRSRHQVERSLERRERRQEAGCGGQPQLIREQVAYRETVPGIDDLRLPGNARELARGLDRVVQSAEFVHHLERARLLARVDPPVSEAEHDFSVQAA